MSPPPLAAVERARSAVEDELAIVETERTAYRRFVRRLDDLEPTRPPGSASTVSAGAATTMAVADRSSAGVEAVHDALRETVLAVPHYEREYGESLLDHVRGEFGSDVAARLRPGATLTPAVVALLRESATQSLSDRRAFLRELRAERESLATSLDRLDEVQSEVGRLYDRIESTDEPSELASIESELAALDERCDDVAAARQAVIHSRSGVVLSGVDDVSLSRYLYDEHETDCPVLATTARRGETILSLRRRCLR